jgi:hypothetical protein
MVMKEVIEHCPHCKTYTFHIVSSEMEYTADVKAYVMCRSCMKSTARWYHYLTYREMVNHAQNIREAHHAKIYRLPTGTAA